MDSWLTPLRGLWRGSEASWQRLRLFRDGPRESTLISVAVSGSATTLYPVLSVVRRAQQIFKVGTSLRVRLRTGTAGSGGDVLFFCFFNGLGSSLGGKHS
jgi:hypothetical protein